MEKDKTYYNDEVSKLQKKVQINPLDCSSWEAMMALATEAINKNIDTERWSRALKVMQQQYELLCK